MLGSCSPFFPVLLLVLPVTAAVLAPPGVPVSERGSCSEQVEVHRSSVDEEGIFLISVVVETGARAFHHKVLYSAITS